ncbi:SDR family NAD(P)-dependent oxidoreductase [Sutcliffiella cohnii]
MRLDQKVFIVTGAQGGMGRETVNRFLEEGARVVAVDLHVNEMAETESFLPIKADLTKEIEVENIYKEAINKFSSIDGLVNIAGIAQPATPIEEISLEEWEKNMSVNAKSIFLMCKAATPHLKENKKGVIVNISSISMVRPRPGLSAYIASKGAVVSFSQALAIELAEAGIRVNVVNPGPTNTQMLGEFSARNVDQSVAKEEIFKKSIPLGRFVEPIDIANSLVYLCSDEAAIVTGSIFNIDGGRGI